MITAITAIIWAIQINSFPIHAEHWLLRGIYWCVILISMLNAMAEDGALSKTRITKIDFKLPKIDKEGKNENNSL